jgi:hypothetical protein
MAKKAPPAKRLQQAARQREAFVTEFVKDFHQTKAALRMGISAESAAARASQLMREPEVQKLIRKHLDEMKAEAFYTRERILAHLWEQANYYGPDSSHAARVKAATELARLRGLDLPQKVEVSGSGVMLVPALGTPEDWGKAASAAQEKLKQEVRK